MSRRRRNLALAATILAVLALVIIPTAAFAKKPPKPPPPPPPPGSDPDPAILYVGVTGKGKSVAHKPMMMNDDGSNQTSAPITGWEPSWSPDGTKIAFYGYNADDTTAIFTVNVDGTGLTKVVNVSSVIGRPAWSPTTVPGYGDGNYRIAYAERVRGVDETFDLYLVNLDGTDKIRLTNTTALMEREPDWSPDGTKLAFKVNDFDDLENRDLWGLYDFSTSTYSLQEHRGDLSGLDVYFPAWSKTDATKIAWCSWDGDQYDLWVVDLDDPTNPVQLTSTSGESERWPSWSPDDSKIVYSSWIPGGRTIKESVKVMDADGTDVQTLVEKGYRPRWRR